MCSFLHSKVKLGHKGGKKCYEFFMDIYSQDSPTLTRKTRSNYIDNSQHSCVASHRPFSTQHYQREKEKRNCNGRDCDGR